MSKREPRGGSATWQSIRDTMMMRIRSQVYPAGSMIPNEVDLAEEFGCARATVNRALRDLASSGFLDRRRKAGTRVCEAPSRKATLVIPLIRVEIESRGQRYDYRLLSREIDTPPEPVRDRLKLSGDERVLKVTSLHLADGAPHMFEERWIVLTTVPGIEQADLSQISPNEWLLRNAPYSHGSMEFLAGAAAERADQLGCAPEAPVLTLIRMTWLDEAPITLARQSFTPDHRLSLEL